MQIGGFIGLVQQHLPESKARPNIQDTGLDTEAAQGTQQVELMAMPLKWLASLSP